MNFGNDTLAIKKFLKHLDKELRLYKNLRVSTGGRGSFAARLEVAYPGGAGYFKIETDKKKEYLITMNLSKIIFNKWTDGELVQVFNSKREINIKLLAIDKNTKQVLAYRYSLSSDFTREKLGEIYNIRDIFKNYDFDDCVTRSLRVVG